MENFRSGVYTSFTINPVHSNNKNREVGVIAICDKSNLVNKHTVVTSLAQAREVFGEATSSNEVMALLTAIFLNSNIKVNVVPISSNTTQNYKNALDLMIQQNVYILCFGSINNDFLQYLQTKLDQYEKLGKEKVAIIPSDDIQDAKAKANINNKRILVSFPKITVKDVDINVSSAVLSSLISSIEDVVYSLNGKTISPDFKLLQNTTDDNIKQLIDAGVCVFENQNNIITLIRAVTTKTLDKEAPDYTYKNLSTILIIDTIIPDIRKILKTKLLNANNSSKTLNSITALIVSKLDSYVDMNYISSYRKPHIYINDKDAGVCFVELSFTIVQGIYQVYLNVQVSV